MNPRRPFVRLSLAGLLELFLVSLGCISALGISPAYANLAVVGEKESEKKQEFPAPIKLDRSDCGCLTPLASSDGHPLKITDLGLPNSDPSTWTTQINCPPPVTDGTGVLSKDSAGENLMADIVQGLNFNDPRRAFIQYVNESSTIKQSDTGHSESYNAVIEYIQKKFDKTYRCGLLDEELVAIAQYTQYGYLDTNGKFDENGTTEKNESLTPVGKYYRRLLKSALRKVRQINAATGVQSSLDPCNVKGNDKGIANKPDGNSVLFHGNTFGGKDRKSIEDMKVKNGDIFSPDAFVSTTSDKKVTDGFGADLLNINSCKYGVYIGQVSVHPDEKEVLFCPGAKFKISGVNTVTSADAKKPPPGGFSTAIFAEEADESDPCADNEWEQFETKLEKQKRDSSHGDKTSACTPSTNKNHSSKPIGAHTP